MNDCIEIHPVTASADGKRNAYCHTCVAVGQRMHYAACLNRLQAVSGSGLDAPKDWAACRTALTAGRCAAEGMREEEVIAGKSIYFVAREVMAAATNAVRKWFVPSDAKTERPRVETRRKARSMFDAIGDAGSYADAINTASSAAEAPAAPVTPTPPRVLPKALPGESPLAMARRLAAERAANPTT